MTEANTIYTHRLRTPIHNDKAELVEEIVFRKPTGGDIMRCGIPVRYMPHDDEQDISFDEASLGKMIGALTGIPVKMIERMDPNDMMECAWAIAPFFLPGMRRPSAKPPEQP